MSQLGGRTGHATPSFGLAAAERWVPERLVVEAHAWGCGPRASRKAFRDLHTVQALQERTVVSKLTESERCVAQENRSTLVRVPGRTQEEVKLRLSALCSAPNCQAAGLVTADFIIRYRGLHPSAASYFTNRLPASVGFLDCPASHHLHVRNTNLLERAFPEERLSTGSIGRFSYDDGHSSSPLPRRAKPASAGRGFSYPRLRPGSLTTGAVNSRRMSPNHPDLSRCELPLEPTHAVTHTWKNPIWPHWQTEG